MELREAVVRASRHYLRAQLPVDWCEMPHDQVLALLKNNMLPYVCFQPAPTIYRRIEILATDMMEIANGTTN